MNEGCGALKRNMPPAYGMLVMRRLIRPLLSVLIAIALAATPIAAQAVMPSHGQCDASVTTHPDQDHAPVPCKSMAPCMNMLTCAPGIALPALQRGATFPLTLRLITYWPFAHAPRGVIPEPALDPPVTV